MTRPSSECWSRGRRSLWALAATTSLLLASCGGDEESGDASSEASLDGTPAGTGPADTTAPDAPGGAVLPLLAAVDAFSFETLFSVPVGEIETLSPVAVSDDVVVGLGGSCSTDAATLVAFDAGSGEPRWELPLPLGFNPVQLSGDGGVVVAVTASAELKMVTGVEMSSGAQLWQADHGPGWVHVHEPVVVVTDGQTVTAIDRASGDVRWETGTPGEFVGATDDVVLIRDDRGLVGLDAVDGSERWVVESTSSYGPVLGAEVIVDAMPGDAVAGIDIATGTELWRRDDLDFADLPDWQKWAQATQRAVQFAVLMSDDWSREEVVDLGSGVTTMAAEGEGGLSVVGDEVLAFTDTDEEKIVRHNASDGTVIEESEFPLDDPYEAAYEAGEYPHEPVLDDERAIWYVPRACPGAD